MRILASFLLINAIAFGQNLTEFGAVAAGSTVGGASGKSVSNGITAIFGKVDQQTAKAAAKEPKKEKEPQAEALKVAPGSAHRRRPGGVPLPPRPPASAPHPRRFRSRNSSCRRKSIASVRGPTSRRRYRRHR